MAGHKKSRNTPKRQHGSRSALGRRGGGLNISRPLLPVDNIYTLVQSYEASAYLTSSVSLNTFTVIGNTLNGFDQAATLIALFDFYRFIETEVIIMPRVQTNVVNDSAFSVVQNLGLLHTVVDQDDGGALTTIGQALDYPTCKIWSAGMPAGRLSHRYVPKTLIGSADAVSLPGQWFSTQSPNQVWYGVKTAWTTTTQVFAADVIIRTKMQFRNTR